MRIIRRSATSVKNRSNSSMTPDSVNGTTWGKLVRVILLHGEYCIALERLVYILCGWG